MGWCKARFKEKDVWVEVDKAGQPVAQGGRVQMRYSNTEGAKLYRASLGNVAVENGAAIESLPDGVSSDAKKVKPSSGFGKAGTRTAQQKAMAAEAARQLIQGLDANVIRCFTDGGCKGNPGPAGSGVMIQMPDGRVGEASESLGVATNNIGELRAIEIAIEMLDALEIPKDHPVAILTDSSYSNGVLCLGWKAKANKDLIKRIRGALSARVGVTVYWVAGHVGLEGNERADALAGRGIEGQSFRTWV